MSGPAPPVDVGPRAVEDEEGAGATLRGVLARARRSPRRIVLPEGGDERIVAGALRAARAGLARPVLLGDPVTIGARLAALGADEPAIDIVDPAGSEHLARYARRYHELRAPKGMDAERARREMTDPMRHAAMMVREGDADGTVGGAVATTAETVRAAFQIIGRAPGVELVSSFMLMLGGPASPSPDATMLFADCALAIEPDAPALAQIALSTADSCRALLGEEARVAFLSFSTAGSARHERVDFVRDAHDLARAARPDLAIDGELQFDAAVAPDVAARKAPHSVLGGRANVCIFPSLEAGNIGYKIAQRLGGFLAIGPVLQGLAKPANDLSRGCSVDDVVLLIAMTGLQAASSVDSTERNDALRPAGNT